MTAYIGIAPPPPPDPVDEPLKVVSGRGESLTNTTSHEAGPLLTRLDLGPVWRGERRRPDAVVLERSDGLHAFPSGINYVFGDSGDGKSWVLMVAALQLMRVGRAVVWITYEDPNEVDIVERLQYLGADEADLEYLHLFSPSEPFRHLTGELARYCRRAHAVLAVLDSVGEALAVDGINEDRDNEFGPWARESLRTLHDWTTSPDWTGADDTKPCPTFAVVPIDHSTKSKDAPHFPSGTKRKRAMVTGLMLSVNVRQPFGIGQFGCVQLVCAKDRTGRFRRGEIVAEFTLDARTTPYTVTIAPPRAGGEMTTGKKRPAAERILEVIDKANASLVVSEITRIANSDGYRLPTEAELASKTVENTLAKLTGINKQKEPTGVAGGYRIVYSAEVGER